MEVSEVQGSGFVGCNSWDFQQGSFLRCLRASLLLFHVKSCTHVAQWTTQTTARKINTRRRPQAGVHMKPSRCLLQRRHRLWTNLIALKTWIVHGYSSSQHEHLNITPFGNVTQASNMFFISWSDNIFILLFFSLFKCSACPFCINVKTILWTFVDCL